MPLKPLTRALIRTLTRTSVAALLTAATAWTQSTAKRFPSPHGKYVIEAEIRDPGGVGAPQTIVSLHRSRNKVATYQDNILVIDGEHPVAVKWEPGDSLAVTITCEGCDLGGAVLKTGKVDDIVISYRTHAPEPKQTTAPESKPPAR